MALCEKDRRPALFIEVKVGKNTLETDQILWKMAIEITPGIKYFQLRPENWEQFVRLIEIRES